MIDIMDLFPDRVLPEPNSGCWFWTGAIDSGRSHYPILIRDGSRFPVHRISAQLRFGAIPTGAMVLHKCDQKTCVNPEHLEIGDNRKNVQDAHARGLHTILVGEACAHSKLTETQVDEIRAVNGRFKRGQQSEMAERFGVCASTIRHVRSNRNWKRPSGRYQSGP